MRIGLLAPVYSGDTADRLLVPVLCRWLEEKGHLPFLLLDRRESLRGGEKDFLSGQYAAVYNDEVSSADFGLLLTAGTAAIPGIPLPPDIPRVALAAEFRTDKDSPTLSLSEDRVNRERFFGISVLSRYEKSLYKLRGLETDIVPEPLLLLPSSFYRSLAAPSPRLGGAFPLFYIQNAYVRQKSGAFICSLGSAAEDISLQSLSIGELIALIDACGSIISDSCRSIALALLLEKPFLALSSPDRGANERMTALLAAHSMTERFCTPEKLPVRFEAKEPLSFDGTEAVRLSCAAYGGRWLERAILQENSSHHKSLPRHPILKRNTRAVKIQSILFPDCDWKHEQWRMMYRGDRLTQLPEEACWELPGGFIECFTYFNSLSVRKWNRYTNASAYRLCLRVKGAFRLHFFGHWLEAAPETSSMMLDEQLDEVRRMDIGDVEKRGLFHKLIRCASIRKEAFPGHAYDTHGSVATITIPVEYNRSSVLGFILSAAAPLRIYEAYWEALCDAENLREVNISLCTTTYKKEEYILPNIQILKSEIFGGNKSGDSEDLAAHLHIHVVDNGRSLDKRDIDAKSVTLHPNVNTGGAGGFTRGMLETLKLSQNGDFPATHILFMDDDVKILPESIKRTYAFLRLIKDEYQSHVISGAMLREEKRNIQFEDVGFMSAAANFWRAQKFPMDLTVWDNVLMNEENYDQQNQFAAWWYCCCPMSYVRPDNLSLPLFFRTDDIEFSLRNKVRAITLNGICLWHMSGEKKYNPVYDKYMTYRNTLFIQATGGVAQNCNFWGEIEKQVELEFRRFNYSNAELLLCAIEDYCKGPEYFAKADWESVLRELGTIKERYRPLEDFAHLKYNLDSLYRYEALDDYDTDLFISSRNGHSLPDYALRNGVGVIPYDFFENPGRQFLKRHLLAINPHDNTAVLRTIDRERYAALAKRYASLQKQYAEGKETLAKAYRAYAKTYMSGGFWENYLGLGAN